ncbi:MAG TPA: hypothetical protein VFS30_06635 [Dehalococcoidia bacterium]|nr:hypothetical protein [Dehalococcoidia bacterium]
MALLVTLAGCKAESTGPGGSADGGSTPGAGIAASEPSAGSPNSTMTAAAEPSATAEPTATTGPKVIEVIGDEAFRTWTVRALALIETRAPEAYAEVLASLDVIESVAAAPSLNVEEKHYAVDEATAHGAGYDENEQLLWFAGTIVHRAHHSALFARGEAHTGKDAEVACLAVQKAALELMTNNPFFANYVQGLIDGADDPANQYWNQSNRHW